jgi:ABC-type dipeptide/oligopeptide/nickel transport system permease component
MRYAATRLGYAVLILFLASLVTFFSLRVSPGNVTSSVFNLQTTPRAVIVAYERTHGLLEPIPVQYWHYISGLLTGHLGNSLVSGLSIVTIFENSVGYTVLLAGTALLIIFGVGVPVGMFAGAHQGRPADHLIRGAASLMLAIPNFLLAIILVIVLGLHLRLLPVYGAGSWKNLVMPAVVLAAEPCALTVRLTRTAYLEQEQSDYTRTLRARGVSERRIRWRHILRNALSPIVSLGVLQVQVVVGYSMIVEVIFGWPGLGTEIVNSILQRDYAVAEILALMLAGIVVVASAVGDLILRAIDPRVRIVAQEA